MAGWTSRASVAPPQGHSSRGGVRERPLVDIVHYLRVGILRMPAGLSIAKCAASQNALRGTAVRGVLPLAGWHAYASSGPPGRAGCGHATRR